MAELLPEFWSSLAPKDPGPTPALRQGGLRRKRAVTDIATWIQCFAMYTIVMPTSFSFCELAKTSGGSHGSHMMPHSGGRHSFRELAVVQSQSLLVFYLFFRSSTGIRCELCLSLSHPTWECTLVCDPDPDVSTRLKTLESAVLAFTSQTQQQGIPQAKPTDICRNWNIGRCRMPHCRYRHVCRVCGGPNLAFACCDLTLSLRPNPNLQSLSLSPPGELRGGPGPSQPMRSLANNRHLGPGPINRSSRVHPGPLPY